MKSLHWSSSGPLQYQTFIKSFEHSIKSKTKHPKDCLYYLEQYTTGPPRNLARSCQYMAADRGFRKAKSLLQEHFGNEHKITTSYMEKALSWSAITTDDTNALQTYTLFLRGCCNTMHHAYMLELDIPANMLVIIKKFPYWLRDKWRTVACDIQENNNQRATFKNMVDFLERQLKIAKDSVFGDIKDNQNSQQRCNKVQVTVSSKDKREHIYHHYEKG